MIHPQKHSENNYRGYDFYDIYRLMVVDFYKKRGMAIRDIQDMMDKNDVQDMQGTLESKKHELEKTIHLYEDLGY